jgi:hypothetical protein
MRYALHRAHSSCRAPRPVEERTAPRKSDAARAAEFPQAGAEPRIAVREISLGSNDGIRTVRLRQPNVVWRVRRTFAAPVNIGQGAEA